MSMMNRLANCKNEYQGHRLKVLCVCSAGLLRSPTLAWVLSNEPYGCNTRAAGIVPEYALIPVDDVLIKWCDEVVCVQKDHVLLVHAMIQQTSAVAKKIWELDVPDSWRFRDPDLVRHIEKELKRVGFNSEP